MSYYSKGGGLTLANVIHAGTNFGDNGMSLFTFFPKSVPAIYNEFGVPGVLLETTQWKKVLHWTIGDATIPNLKAYGQRLAESLEGY